MTDSLKEGLYGKTVKIRLADGNEYTLREPDIDTLEAIDFKNASLEDVKTIKKLAFAMLKEDNGDLTEVKLGKLITFSMLKPDSQFFKAILSILGSEQAQGNE